MASEGGNQDASTATDDARLQSDTSNETKPPTLSRSSTFGVKKCWICIGDTTEDDPDNPPVWRAPCTCNLTAHEDCLLDWVADLENPKNGRRRATPSKILCPQCRSEIKIARPKSVIVEATKGIDRMLGQLVLPAMGFGLLGTVYAGMWCHGFQSVLVVFGQKGAEAIFESAATNHKGWLGAYALVPINLIFSRTSYSDFVLPSGTLFLLATQISDNFEIDMTVWPPLPSTVFACLPAFRTVYNLAYTRAFGALNEKWLKEIQPSRADIAEGQEQNIADIQNAQEAEAEDGQFVLQLEVNLGGGGGDDDNDANPAPDDADNNNAGNGDANAADAQNGHAHQILGERGGEIVETTSGIGETIVGALAFPYVAAGMGGLLTFLVPGSWMTSANFSNGRPGLFNTKWGRSVVGGCLFVVLKDALVLYCRWRMAQSHRSRRIMDYDKQTKKYSV